MKATNGEGSPGRRYLALLAVPDEADGERWSLDDLRAILDHQLDAPLGGDLRHAARAVDCAGAGGALARCRCITFRDLLQCPNPSAELLTQAKAFAKGSIRAGRTLPSEVARCLYVLAVLRARMYRIAGVSTLSDAAIVREASRCLTCSWLSGEVRTLLWLSLAGAGLDDAKGEADRGGNQSARQGS